jgi:hypothetical protein
MGCTMVLENWPLMIIVSAGLPGIAINKQPLMHHLCDVLALAMVVIFRSGVSS